MSLVKDIKNNDVDVIKEKRREKSLYYNQKRPLIIAGPCSAETEDQLVSTACLLKDLNVADVLRAGIWKPRTRPDSFSGVGSIGLQWLKTAKEKTGLPTMVEVASAKHVEEALLNDVDFVWIGARTTVNPFSVQEISEALKNSGVMVFIKNPLNADLELWIGAVERIAAAGTHQIALVHRGFSSYGNRNYRNAPLWHLPIEMKRRYPHLMLINDPSHISGCRDSIFEITQKAIDLNYDGLMIETHINPDKAWSDAQQQITPDALHKLLSNIVWRKESIKDEHEFLEELRRKIDGIDEELLSIMAERMKVVDAIGEYKKANNLTIVQTKRWNDIITKALNAAPSFNLSEAFIRNYLEAIHLESIHHQTKIFENNND